MQAQEHLADLREGVEAVDSPGLLIHLAFIPALVWRIKETKKQSLFDSSSRWLRVNEDVYFCCNPTQRGTLLSTTGHRKHTNEIIVTPQIALLQLFL